MAENALEFEHRDLHWGNILICRTDNDFVESRLLGEKKTVASHGVHVSLIDFTLSRLTKGILRNDQLSVLRSLCAVLCQQ